jgi:hypothetical protein
MGPQDPKDVTRDTARDLSGLVVVAVGLRYSGGVHTVPPCVWSGSRGYINACGTILFVSRHGIRRPKPYKGIKNKYYARQRIFMRPVDNPEQDA